MADKFDPYRDAQVMEEQTIWPEELDELEAPDRARIARMLHDHPEEATELEYVRTHTGFARCITVHPEDVERLQAEAE